MSEPDESRVAGRPPDARTTAPPDGAVERRAPWRAPQATRIPVSQTLLGGTTGDEGNGVFAFRQVIGP